MHEMSITQSILDLVVGEAQKQGAKKITLIRLKIGELTNVDPMSVEFYLEVIGKGTIAEGVKLEADVLPITAECNDCGRQFKIESWDYVCPACGSKSAKMVTGRELYVESIEVE
jgi:hydrogenase nickel incorporation protein HypA/HybF